MKPRGLLIAGNWKMNHGPREAEAFLNALADSLKSRLPLPSGLSLSLCPPAVSLAPAVSAAARLRLPIRVLAQNAHWEQKGAFTGELSGPLVKETGAQGSLVGHSERRQFFGETDETVRKRTESLLGQGLQVILCVGETRAEREAGSTRQVLLRQLSAVLTTPGQGAAAFLDGRLVIAYEPVWAIGTGLTATPAQAEEAHQIIRKDLWDRFGMDAAGRTPLLYGGSVTPENVRELLGCANVDGALVGGASLKPESYLALIEGAISVLS